MIKKSKTDRILGIYIKLCNGNWSTRPKKLSNAARMKE